MIEQDGEKATTARLREGLRACKPNQIPPPPEGASRRALTVGGRAIAAARPHVLRFGPRWLSHDELRSAIATSSDVAMSASRA